MKLDGVHKCLDSRCQGDAHDVVYTGVKDWTIQCCFCGTGQRVPPVHGLLQADGAGFVFHDGRCAGLTIAEALRQPRGRDYVEWAAKEHKRPAVRDACTKALLTAGPASV